MMSKIYLLNNQKFTDVINLEVFKIDYIKTTINLKNYDALIFTSKNAIYSLDSFNKTWKELESYAIAPNTAKIITQLNGNLTFTGKSSHGNDFAQELLEELKNKKVLYVRAKKVVSNLVDILKKNNILIDELITYETSCNKKEDIQIEKNSIVIFTSPSSVECFFKNYKWHESMKAVAIGKTTANYIPENINYFISTKTSVEECVKLAQKLTI